MLQFIIRSSLVASQLPLLKGAKCDSAEQGIVRFWEGWCGARDSAEGRSRWGAVGAVKELWLYYRTQF